MDDDRAGRGNRGAPQRFAVQTQIVVVELSESLGKEAGRRPESTCVGWRGTDVLALLTLGVAFGGVHIPALVAAKLVLTLVSGSLPFCAMGLAIGYFAGPTSAPAVINIFYLPMSFCSGLWMPFMFLPKFVQKIAVFLPPYHLSQLAFHQVGAGQGGPILWHWESLAGFSLICLGIAWVGHQRDQKANG